MIRLVKDTIVIEEKNYVYLFSLVTKKAGKVLIEAYDESFLKNHGFFNDISLENKDIPKTPRSIFLLLTLNCPLRCVYCYASAGEKKGDMPLEIADAAVNAYLNLSPLQPAVHFTAGGEPTIREDLIKYIINKYDGRIKRWSLITSGVVSAEFLRWLVDKNVRITFSIDGPPIIQNKTRPLKSGKGSSSIVESNAITYRHLTGRLSVRSTVTKWTLLYLRETLDYFLQIGVTRLHLEPMYPMGRGVEWKDLMPLAQEMVEALVYALEWGRINGVIVTSSPIIYFSSSPSSNWCGPVEGWSLGVTYEGYVTACSEVIDFSHPFGNMFIVGKLENNRFLIDWNKLELFQRSKVENIEPCKNCFARYVCRGGCPVRRLYITKDINKPDPLHCFLVKNLVPHIVMRAIEGAYKIS